MNLCVNYGNMSYLPPPPPCHYSEPSPAPVNTSCSYKEATVEARASEQLRLHAASLTICCKESANKSHVIERFCCMC
jgi:hypothetical protein